MPVKVFMQLSSLIIGVGLHLSYLCCERSAHAMTHTHKHTNAIFFSRSLSHPHTLFSQCNIHPSQKTQTHTHTCFRCFGSLTQSCWGWKGCTCSPQVSSTGETEREWERKVLACNCRCNSHFSFHLLRSVPHTESNVRPDTCHRYTHIQKIGVKKLLWDSLGTHPRRQSQPLRCPKPLLK